MNNPEPILRDVFRWEGAGAIAAVFDRLAIIASIHSAELPWGNNNQDANYLNILYFANHSGGKFCSPLVKYYLSKSTYVDEDGLLNSRAADQIGQMLYLKYINAWQHLWDTYDVEYSPLNNYDITETRELSGASHTQRDTDGTVSYTGTDANSTSSSETITHGKVDTITHGKTETVSGTRSDTVTHGKTVTTDKEVATTEETDSTDTTTHGKTTTVNESVFGFNSTDPSPSSRTVSADTGTTGVVLDKNVDSTESEDVVVTEGGTTGESETKSQTTTHGGTTKDTESGTTQTGRTGSDTETRNLLDTTDETIVTAGTNSEDEEIHRVGTTGVMSRQKMIQEEREVWIWNYFDQIFSDLDNELALSFHDPCRV